MSKIARCTPSASKMALNGPHLMGIGHFTNISFEKPKSSKMQ
jgi:hypothetical protein